MTHTDWDRYEAEIAEASDPAAIARSLHPSRYAGRTDLTVVPRRSVTDETKHQADQLTIWIALRYPMPGLLAEVEGWETFQWDAVATAAGQPRPTDAVKCVVIGYVRSAAKAVR